MATAGRRGFRRWRGPEPWAARSTVFILGRQRRAALGNWCLHLARSGLYARGHFCRPATEAFWGIC